MTKSSVYYLYRREFRCYGDGSDAPEDVHCGRKIPTRQWVHADGHPVTRYVFRCAECSELAWRIRRTKMLVEGLSQPSEPTGRCRLCDRERLQRYRLGGWLICAECIHELGRAMESARRLAREQANLRER